MLFVALSKQQNTSNSAHEQFAAFHFLYAVCCHSRIFCRSRLWCMVVTVWRCSALVTHTHVGLPGKLPRVMEYGKGVSNIIRIIAAPHNLYGGSCMQYPVLCYRQKLHRDYMQNPSTHCAQRKTGDILHSMAWTRRQLPRTSVHEHASIASLDSVSNVQEIVGNETYNRI